MLSNDVTGLRRWASDERHALPARPAGRIVIGTAGECWIRLGPEHQLARTRVEIIDTGSSWRVSAVCGDMWVDGEPRRECVLSPGVELRIGGITYIVESARSTAVRGFCRRILGYRPHHQGIVDLAMRSIRSGLAGRTALLIAGDDDLVPVAFQLFRRAAGDNAPFVVCDPKRATGRVSLHHPVNVPNVDEALTAATSGAVCVRTRQLPEEFSILIARCLHPDTMLPLFICGSISAEVRELQSARPIVIPPLRDRLGELPELIRAYASDSLIAMGAPGEAFSDVDLQWLLQYPMRSLWEMECAVYRVVALNMTGSPGKAAMMLGLSKATMRLWCDRHGLSRRGRVMSSVPRAELPDAQSLNAET